MSEYVDPVTGEVVDGEYPGQDEANSMAAEMAQVDLAIADLEDDLRPLITRRQQLERMIRPHLERISRADGGQVWAVLEPPVRPAQRVSRDGAEQYREQLLALRLGREEMVYKPPTISDVRAARAEIIAAGIPIEVIAPEPTPGPSTVKLIPKAAVS